MKKLLTLAALLASSAALAAPFVAPAAWTTNKPSDVQTGGVLRTINLADFKSLNPFTYRESPSLPFTLTAGGLMVLDVITNEYIPYMAESYKLSPDKTTFTFKIRSGMKWSDGKDMTADDWMTTFTIETDEKVGSNSFSGWFPNDKPIKVTKIGSDTIQMKFPFPDVTAFERAAGFYPNPTHIYMPVYKSKGAEGIKEMDSVTSKPESIVTSGPFKLEKYTAGERAVLVKNPFYGEWNKDSVGKPLPYLDGVQINFVADQNAYLAQYLAGNVDLYSPDNRDRLAQVKGAVDGKKLDAALIVNASSRASSDFMVLNMDNGNTFKGKLFRNVKFRQALSMLTNRDAMVDLTLGGLGQPTYTGVYPVFTSWISKDADKYKYNVAQANAYLDALGFQKRGADGIRVDGKGNRLSFNLTTNAENTRRQQFAGILKEDFKKAGVEINTSFIAFNLMTEQLDAKPSFAPRAFDAIIIGLTGGSAVFPGSGDNVLKCTKLPDDGNLHMFNQTNKCLFPFETQMLNLYYKGRQEFDLGKRRNVSLQLQKLESENQPVNYLAAQTVHYSWLSKVQGEYQRPQINAINASTLFGPRYLDLTWIKK
jgi:peptide/nickel transport system substrate-binding protein